MTGEGALASPSEHRGTHALHTFIATSASKYPSHVQALWLDPATNEQAQRLAEECKAVIRRMLVRSVQLLQ